MEISRDKSNPTWVLVGDHIGECNKKRIIVDTFIDGGCIAVREVDSDKYIKGECYEVSNWKYFKEIKLPKYRPYKNCEEFIEELKKHTLPYVIACHGAVYTINKIDILHQKIKISPWSEYTVNQLVNLKWLDTGEPLGVLEG